MTRQITQLDQDIMAWQQANETLTAAKNKELELRNRVFAEAFPNAVVGTNTFDLGAKYELKGVRKLNYNLANGNDETANALDEIEKLGNEGPFIAERLVTWKPSLSVSEYKALQVDGPNPNPLHVKIKEIIDAVLTITDGTPTLEVKVPPKK